MTLEPGQFQALARAMGPTQPKAECDPIVKAGPPRKAKGQPAPPWTTDAHLKAAKPIVRDRSGGMCEVVGCFEPAHDVHHLAGRGFAGCHHPDLLRLLCGTGNIDGHHGRAHQVSLEGGLNERLRLPWGTTADQLVDGWLP